MPSDQQRREARSESERAPGSRRPAEEVRSRPRPDQLRTAIRDVSFPTAVRGYDRNAVDTYVARVNRVIAELEIGSSPQAAVRHALDQVGEQLGDVLAHARQAAEEITAEARAEADAMTSKAAADAQQITEDVELQAQQVRERSKQQSDERLARAKEQAAELILRAEEQARAMHEEAEPRLRELEADTEAVWDARRKLLDDLPRMATELMEIAGAASARIRRPPDAGGSPKPRQPWLERNPADAGAATAPAAGRAAEPR